MVRASIWNTIPLQPLRLLVLLCSGIDLLVTCCIFRYGVSADEVRRAPEYPTAPQELSCYIAVATAFDLQGFHKGNVFLVETALEISMFPSIPTESTATNR